MKILIPTAKELNTQVAQIEPESLSEKTKLIIQALSQYSVTDLVQLYQIRPEKAEEEYQRIQELQNETAPTYPALYLFDGLMYRNIKRKDLSKEEERYIRNHILITSSLYGVIPALAPIAPHRLDFMTKLNVEKQSLKKLWTETYGQAVADQEILLSLLSSEFEDVFPKEVRDKMIRFKFMEEKDGKRKIHSTISKKARGRFLTALIEEQIQNIEDIKKLNFAGFAFQENLSTDQELVFIKQV
ncbi:peroxide stress protein YaaA [Streptococcus gordonii]|uniref:peroxide stress protein YaaA n=1 Tax=Streptococcus gordonii TaxID=1302 RepID=UPI00200160ED|nr:peroxide stress protein YaaA [Streptococcus gordonii]